MQASLLVLRKLSIRFYQDPGEASSSPLLSFSFLSLYLIFCLDRNKGFFIILTWAVTVTTVTIADSLNDPPSRFNLPTEIQFLFMILKYTDLVTPDFVVVNNKLKGYALHDCPETQTCQQGYYRCYEVGHYAVILLLLVPG